MILGNNVQIICGFMAFEPDMKQTSKSKLLQCKIHVKERIKGQDGLPKDIHHYIECKAWGFTAENMEKHVSKGDYVEIYGKCVTEQWEKDGKKNRKQVCEIDSFRNVSKILGKTDQPDTNNYNGGFGAQGGDLDFSPNAPKQEVRDDGLPAAFGQVPSFQQENSQASDQEIGDLI